MNPLTRTMCSTPSRPTRARDHVVPDLLVLAGVVIGEGAVGAQADLAGDVEPAQAGHRLDALL